MDSILLALLMVVGYLSGFLISTMIQSDKKIERKHSDKTPYEHALDYAAETNSKLRNDLHTIRATNRLEADTERIRNEIDTILSGDGEEAPEGADETRWMYDGRKYIPHEDFGIERLKAGTMDCSTINAIDYGECIPIQKHSDGTISQAPWDTRIPMEEMADNISKAVARMHGTNVREDGSEDERMTEDDVERSLINDIKDKASENLELAVEFAKMIVQDDEAIRKQLEETSKELAEEIKDTRRRMRKYREEGKYYGETLYRKGNR